MLASHVRLLAEQNTRDLAQALQNFVNQSPWDERQLWRHYRTRLTEQFGTGPGVFVLDDLGFPKHGQHSVGVQRQFCSSLGRKVNCQLAVALSQCGPGGAVPLLLRLYLPRAWWSDPVRLQMAGVPAECRSGQSKASIALELLDEVGPVPGDVVVAGGSYGSAQELRDGLVERRLTYLFGVPKDFAVRENSSGGQVSVEKWTQHRAPEGRWVDDSGDSAPEYEWHQVLPASDDPASGKEEPALGLLIERCRTQPAQYALSNLPGENPCEVAVNLWQQRDHSGDLYRRLREELGLDHFEGRSWRGFHHHACLVMLAYGFLLSEQTQGRSARALPEACEAAPCG